MEIDETKVDTAPPIAPTAPSAPTKKEEFMGRVKERYPDNDYEDEDARYGAYSQYVDDISSERDKYKESNDKFADAYARDPRFAAIAQEAVKDGGNVASKMVEVYGRDVMEAFNDPEQIAALTEANNKYLADVAEMNEIAKEQEKNKTESDKIIAEFLAENDMAPEEGEKFLEGYYQMIEDGLMGIVRKEYLESYMKSLNYDSDLVDAARAGEVKGMNEQHDKMVKKQIGDGIADISSQGKDDTMPTPSTKGMKKRSFYD